MTLDTKEQIKSTGKTLGLVAAASAVVGIVAYLVLAPATKTVTLTWDYSTNSVPITNVIFEFVSKTNLAGKWQFYTNVVGTNVLVVPNNKAQEFFTISRVMLRDNTNFQTVQIGF